MRSTPHVIATTVTAVMGLVPLLLQASEFWTPLAICVAAGVSGTTILALTFTPCAYLVTRAKRLSVNTKPATRFKCPTV